MTDRRPYEPPHLDGPHRLAGNPGHLAGGLHGHPDRAIDGAGLPDGGSEGGAPGLHAVAEHAARQLHPGAPEAVAAAARALCSVAWTWARTRLRALRRPEPSFHEAWCNDPGRCECWRFLLEADPGAERFMTELDNNQRRDR